jgi:hypothetical protein
VTGLGPLRTRLQRAAGRAHRRVMSRSLELSPVFLRIALGTSFLSAVADRLGLWGASANPMSLGVIG